MPQVKRPVLTLRFKKPSTHRRLKEVSKVIGASMNEVAETVIEQGLDYLAADAERELRETIERLRGWEYTDSEFEKDAIAFAEGEASERDPLRSTMTEFADSAGVGEIFVHPVER